MTALDDVADRIVQTAQTTSASANHLLVHRQLIGQLREALQAREYSIVVGRGSIARSGLRWQLRADGRANNQDLRDVAALLIAAAEKLESEPDAVDTEITA